MRINLFWDKYDRLTPQKSFFELNYKEFIPELSSREYEHIIATKICEDLRDDFRNLLKITIIQSLELLEASYTSELSLCSQKRLIKFMENVLQYVKIERLYLSYLEDPPSSGIPAGENTLLNSLGRFKSLLRDFTIITGFASKKEIDDFDNAKELVQKFSNYFRLYFSELHTYCLSITHQGLNPYNYELKLISEVLALCDEIETPQVQQSTAQTPETLTEDSKIHESDELSWILGNNYNASADYKKQLKTSMQVTSGISGGLIYKRLEPEYQFKASLSQYTTTATTRDLNKKSLYSTVPSERNDETLHQYQQRYDFHKYDKEFKDNRPQHSKKAVKEDLNVRSILTKSSIHRTVQERDVFSSVKEPLKNPLSFFIDSPKAKHFPLTSSIEKAEDLESCGGLLSLVNIEYDPHVGMKLTTDKSQQERIKKRAQELEEMGDDSSARRPRINIEEDSMPSHNSFDSESDEELDMREKKDLLNRRRKNLNQDTHIGFHKLATRLHGEPTIINNYAFYENTLLKYEKPTRAYLQETEKVLERPTHEIEDAEEDYCFRELSPRSARRKFLEHVFGAEQEKRLHDKYSDVIMKTKFAEIVNNTALRTDVLQKMQRNIEKSKGFSLEKSKVSRESVKFFFKYNEDTFKPSELDDKQRKERIRHLWQVVRDWQNTRIFYKKICRKTAKSDMNTIAKIKSTNLTQNLFKGQETLIFHRKHKDTSGIEKEFVVLNRLMNYRLKLDYVFNLDKIQKPVYQQIQKREAN